MAGIDFVPAPIEPPVISYEPDWVVRGPDYVNALFLRGANVFIPLEREVATVSRGGGIYAREGQPRTGCRARARRCGYVRAIASCSWCDWIPAGTRTNSNFSASIRGWVPGRRSRRWGAFPLRCQ